MLKGHLPRVMYHQLLKNNLDAGDGCGGKVGVRRAGLGEVDPVGRAPAEKVDVRLPGIGNSSSHDTRPVYSNHLED